MNGASGLGPPASGPDPDSSSEPEARNLKPEACQVLDRRQFVAMLGAAAAALAVRDRGEPEPVTPTVWIGHC